MNGDHVVALLLVTGSLALVPAYIQMRRKENDMHDDYLPRGGTRGSGMESWEQEEEVACYSDDGEHEPCSWEGTALVGGEGNVGQWDCPRCNYTHDYEREN